MLKSQFNQAHQGHWNRRQVLASSGVFLASSVAKVAMGTDSAFTTPVSPQEAIERLKAGNQRFAAGQTVSAHRDLARVKAIAARQTPFAAFLGCADSRVPIEIVFDQGFGDLFVTRIAGNIAANEIIGSLEFGTEILGAKVLYVLGHSSCGAVAATMRGDEVPGQISGLFQYIRPAIKASAGDMNRAVRENVRNQAILIAESSPVIAKLLKRNELIVAGGVYDLETGIVESVETDVN